MPDDIGYEAFLRIEGGLVLVEVRSTAGAAAGMPPAVLRWTRGSAEAMFLTLVRAAARTQEAASSLPRRIGGHGRAEGRCAMGMGSILLRALENGTQLSCRHGDFGNGSSLGTVWIPAGTAHRFFEAVRQASGLASAHQILEAAAEGRAEGRRISGAAHLDEAADALERGGPLSESEARSARRPFLSSHLAREGRTEAAAALRRLSAQRRREAA